LSLMTFSKGFYRFTHRSLLPARSAAVLSIPPVQFFNATLYCQA
jgi:hypothetical protein